MSTAIAELNEYKKPYYTLEFTGEQLGLEIRINDIPAFNVDNSGFMTLEIPINEYLIAKDNEIKVITFPRFDDNDEQNDNYISGNTLLLSIYVREDDEPSEKRVLLNQTLITPSNAYTKNSEEDIAVSKTDKNTRFTFEINSSTINLLPYGVYKKQVVTSWKIPGITTKFPKWLWENSVVINNNKDTYNSLLNEYMSVYNAFKNKNIDKIKKISEYRSKELAAAYYLNDVEEGFKYSSFGEFINHKTAELYEELNTNNVTLQIVGNGKLARIIDGSGIHPVVFVNYDTEQVYKPQFVWCKNKNNEWFLIR